jgi:DNA-binding response OmpR family regulator
MGRILIAEDDKTLRQLLSHLLVEDGHEVAVAVNGAQALEKVDSYVPDLLLLDLMMPVLDGFGVLEQLRESGREGSVKVLVLTAKGSEADIERSLALGACQHMIKPFDPEELLDTISQLLELSMEEIMQRQEEEHNRASLLSQLESIFSSEQAGN